MLAMRSERCLHKFHKDCLHQWLTARRADYCPICRSDILTEDEWKKIYARSCGDSEALENEVVSREDEGEVENSEEMMSPGDEETP